MLGFSPLALPVALFVLMLAIWSVRQFLTVKGNINLARSRGDSREISMTSTQTFRRIGLVFSKPEKLCADANAWLAQQHDLRKVWLSLEITNGQVWGLTLSCERGPGRQDASYVLDVIVVIHRDIIAALASVVLRPKIDPLIEAWRQKHPNAQVITQRIVTTRGTPSEAWILYRT